MLARAERHGVASVTWRELGGCLLAFSHGPAEASSHVETTLTQLVQEAVVVAQVRWPGGWMPGGTGLPPHPAAAACPRLPCLDAGSSF
jgi:hypothetical protein